MGSVGAAKGNTGNSILDLSRRTLEQLDTLYESAAAGKDLDLMKDIRVARSVKSRGFGALLTKSELTITGNNGTFIINYKENSQRTKAFKQFISQVLKAYGTEGVEEIKYQMERR